MKEKFKILVEDFNVPFTPWYIINKGSFSDDLKKATKGKISCDTLFIFEKERVFWGPKISQFSEAGEYFSKKIINSSKYQKRLIDIHYKYLKEIENFAKNLLTENLTSKSNRNLFKIYNKYYCFYKKMQFEGVVMGFVDMGENKLVDIIKKEISEEIDNNNFDKDFSKLITPNKCLHYGEENLEILKAIRKIQENKSNLTIIINSKSFDELPKNLKNIFDNLAKRFGWLQYYYFGPAAKGEYYFNLIKSKIDIDVEKETDKNKNEKNELKKFQNIYKNKLSPKSQEKIDILKELTYLKEYRKEIQVYFLNYSMDRWFKEIARRYYITPILARYILLEEYKAILLNSKVLKTEELHKRYNNCAYLLENGKIKLYSGDKAKECWKLFIKEKNNNNISELKGSIAYPGKRRGRVMIVNSTNDLAKFKKGCILVSFSTNPSLMPAINIASAIITNTGGITCHAAIISRELKIPCVIGTKIATKILKDGDMVEVDANRGIVKIIK